MVALHKLQRVCVYSTELESRTMMDQYRSNDPSFVYNFRVQFHLRDGLLCQTCIRLHVRVPFKVTSKGAVVSDYNEVCHDLDGRRGSEEHWLLLWILIKLMVSELPGLALDLVCIYSNVCTL